MSTVKPTQVAAFAAVSSLLAVLFATGAAMADTSKPVRFLTQYGKTLPPIGFVKFCHENPKSCSANGRKQSEGIPMSKARWQLVNEINAYVNHKIAPVSDQELYGQAEYWTYPVDAGDCEDYVLLKQRYLSRLGLPDGSLLVTVVLDEKKEGHAVLTVSTSEGDYVLDNRTDEIKPFTSTNYTYLKRQSHQNPKAWIALVPQKTSTRTAASKSN